MLAISQLMQKKIENALKNFEVLSSEMWERPDVGINYALALYLGKAKEKARKVISEVEISQDKNFKDY